MHSTFPTRGGQVSLVRLLAALLGLLPAAAGAETVVIATLEWPPYTGAALREQGASAAVVRAAFRAVGHDVRFEFMPWARAVKLGTFTKRYAGYFPAYESEQRTKDSLRSDVIGSSRVGFAHVKTLKFSWQSLDDLAQYRIGVVRGYVNTAEFDRRMADGRLTTEAAAGDEVNLLKLGLNRLDLVVIDHAVFRGQMQNHPPLAPYRDQLVFHEARLLEEKPLYVYFRRDADGERWREMFDRGLARIDHKAVFRAALENGE